MPGSRSYPCNNHRSILMNPSDFRLILIKYRKGNCTDNEREMVEAWYKDLDKGQTLDLGDGEKDILEGEIWLRVTAKIKGTAHSHPKPLRFTGFQWLSAAASVLAIMAVSFYVFKFQPLKELKNAGAGIAEIEKENDVVTYKNQGTAVREITLADGSVVSLYPASELAHGKKFNQATREVTLTGEAFFRVAKNADKPFFVRTRDITTKVLGTSFNIKAYPSQKNSTVSVKTGRVEVSNHNGTRAETVVLTPNQQIVFVASEGLLRKGLAEKPEALANQHMDFEERPVEEVFAALEETFGVEINYDRNAMRDCSVTISFTSENLPERMAILCKILGASYEEKDAALFVQSNGCDGGS